ncbi:hypothetical protein [Pseudodonghicola flavimaris]|uniref:Transmembrane protein n=1 Tax=Pseudodonghicola flavimaris TaxID=3050036 RepID=A0ABT7EUT5_9RHOB|nr:hypothetical protein [Pseudodonghicola flavimaris]MDK3016106.1 hypothetical protein [Pseudodonghicola flavimaris]
MTHRLHAASGALALLMILGFWSATALSELFGGPELIARVKMSILYGMLVMVPAMALAGSTGARLGRGMRLPQVGIKMTRMKVIAANGIAVLLPSAVFLALKAQAGQFDTRFALVQGLELVAGATNITLLALNMRDGLRLAARRQRARA